MKGKIVLQLMICLVLLACGAKSGKKVTERLAFGLAARVYNIGMAKDIRNFEAATREVFARNDSMLTHFKCRLEAEQKETNPYYKNKISELEEETERLKKQILEYSTDQKKEWELFKQEFSAELADLEQSHRELRLSNTHPEIVCK